MRKSLIAFVACAVMHSAALPMQAAVPAPKSITDSIFEIKEVSVVATRNLTPQQTISRVQIENLASSSVADALKYMSGVQIKDYGGLGGQKTGQAEITVHLLN